MRIDMRTMVLAAALLVGAGVGRTAAQAPLASADAAAFLGAWSLTLDTPQGSTTMDLTLKDDKGKVAGTISSDMMAEQAITDISKDGESLVLAYSLDYQGQAIPAKIKLVPEGNSWKASFDFADGQFVMDGTASKH
jgi:hypothetical protein